MWPSEVEWRKPLAGTAWGKVWRKDTVCAAEKAQAICVCKFALLWNDGGGAGGGNDGNLLLNLMLLPNITQVFHPWFLIPQNNQVNYCFPYFREEEKSYVQKVIL